MEIHQKKKKKKKKNVKGKFEGSQLPFRFFFIFYFKGGEGN